MTENYANNLQEPQLLLEALQWYLDHGVDELLLDEPSDRTEIPDLAGVIAKAPPLKAVSQAQSATSAAPDMMGAAEAIVEAQKLASECDTLEALKEAITGFNGLSVKKTATNMVFSDGNSEASIMLVGDAPSADDDVQGIPFMGENGQLLDKILACIDLGRKVEDEASSIYISNVLNWRPPGNRTPTQAEMDVSYPFIARHIALVKPKILILCGGIAGKTLLKRTDSISKMRGGFHDVEVGGHNCLALVTYHPAYLLKTPAQKKAVWADMLMLQAKMKEVL